MKKIVKRIAAMGAAVMMMASMSAIGVNAMNLHILTTITLLQLHQAIQLTMRMVYGQHQFQA